MAPRRGFEPLTCPLGGGRAIQLCHRGETSGTGLKRQAYYHTPTDGHTPQSER